MAVKTLVAEFLSHPASAVELGKHFQLSYGSRSPITQVQ